MEHKRKNSVPKALLLSTMIFSLLLPASCAGRKAAAVKRSSSSLPQSMAVVTESSTASSPPPAESKAAETVAAASSTPLHGAKHIICVDPGHQKRVDTSTEPIAPGADEMKMKNPGGAEGVCSKTPEYAINMLVSKKIQNQLIRDGYTVVMTREDNSANISNIGRAEIANNAGADIFLRIHADSADNEAVTGASVLIPKAGYIKDGALISESKAVGGCILKGLTESTGAKSRGLSPRDDMTGFNWSKVPVVLVEAGFLSNPHEDGLLNTDEYQNKIAEGIVNGINSYFTDKDR